MVRRPSDAALIRGLSQSGPGGKDGEASSCSFVARSSAFSAWKEARPRFEKYGRGTFSGRRSGSRRRIEITSAPAASAFSHSVAAAIPAPTIATRDAYSCGSYACTALGIRASPGCPVATSTCSNGPSPSSSNPPSTARIRSIRRCTKLCSQPLSLDDAAGMPDEVLDERVVAVRRRLQHRLQRPLAQRLAHREPRER